MTTFRAVFKSFRYNNNNNKLQQKFPQVYQVLFILFYLVLLTWANFEPGRKNRDLVLQLIRA